MKSIKIRHSILLVITALIWGVAFVAQSSGGDAVGPFTFNSVRSLIGGLILIPIIVLLEKIKTHKNNKYIFDKTINMEDRKTLIKGGVLCGVLLFLATTSQQLGITGGTAAGKAGFITACYILMVPILGLFIKKKCGWNVWIGAALALFGLYLLCIGDKLTIQFSDFLVFICAFIFSFHILVVDHFSPLVDGIKMSCIQFFTCGIIGLVPMFFVEMKHSVSGIMAWAPLLATWEAWIPILYAGVMSCGIAYTLQIIGQKGLNPTIASLLMSLESVFSVLAGWMILHEKLGLKELSGCMLIFIAVAFAQIPFDTIKENKQK